MIMLLGLWACEEPDKYSKVPQIWMEEVQFKKVENATDSLVVRLSFQDGDGDLGLRADEKQPPYHLLKYPKKGNGSLITLGDHDSLPAYNACDYVIEPVIDGNKVKDTVFVQFNPNHYNIFVRFYYDKDGDGETEFYDFRREFGRNSCETYDGRFFPLKADDSPRPLKGELTYSMPGFSFAYIFRTNKVAIEVTIVDRAGNRSNTVRKEFFLNDITVTI